MAIVAHMACGCKVDVADALPYCETHRETRVQGVTSPPPRIVAKGCKATGPLVIQEG